MIQKNYTSNCMELDNLILDDLKHYGYSTINQMSERLHLTYMSVYKALNGTSGKKGLVQQGFVKVKSGFNSNYRLCLVYYLPDEDEMTSIYEEKDILDYAEDYYYDEINLNLRANSLR